MVDDARQRIGLEAFLSGIFRVTPRDNVSSPSRVSDAKFRQWHKSLVTAPQASNTSLINTVRGIEQIGDLDLSRIQEVVIFGDALHKAHKDMLKLPNCEQHAIKTLTLDLQPWQLAPMLFPMQCRSSEVGGTEELFKYVSDALCYVVLRAGLLLHGNSSVARKDAHHQVAMIANVLVAMLDHSAAGKNKHQSRMRVTLQLLMTHFAAGLVCTPIMESMEQKYNIVGQATAFRMLDIEKVLQDIAITWPGTIEHLAEAKSCMNASSTWHTLMTATTWGRSVCNRIIKTTPRTRNQVLCAVQENYLYQYAYNTKFKHQGVCNRPRITPHANMLSSKLNTTTSVALAALCEDTNERGLPVLTGDQATHVLLQACFNMKQHVCLYGSGSYFLNSIPLLSAAVAPDILWKQVHISMASHLLRDIVGLFYVLVDHLDEYGSKVPPLLRMGPRVVMGAIVEVLQRIFEPQNHNSMTCTWGVRVDDETGCITLDSGSACWTSKTSTKSLKPLYEYPDQLWKAVVRSGILDLIPPLVTRLCPTAPLASSKNCVILRLSYPYGFDCLDGQLPSCTLYLEQEADRLVTAPVWAQWAFHAVLCTMVRRWQHDRALLKLAQAEVQYLDQHMQPLARVVLGFLGIEEQDALLGSYDRLKPPLMCAEHHQIVAKQLTVEEEQMPVLMFPCIARCSNVSYTKGCWSYC